MKPCAPLMSRPTRMFQSEMIFQRGQGRPTSQQVGPIDVTRSVCLEVGRGHMALKQRTIESRVALGPS